MAVENVSATCVQGCHLGGLEMKPLDEVRPVGYRFVRSFQPYRPYRLRYCCNVSDDLILSHSDQVPLLFSVMGGNSTVISFLFKAGESSMINSYWSHRLVPSNITLNGTEPLIGQNIPHAAVVIPQKGQKRKKRKYNSSWRCWIRRQSVQKCRSTRNINKRHRYQTNSRKEFM